MRERPPPVTLWAGARRLLPAPRALLMGVLNATQDSFSDSPAERGEPAANRRLQRLLDEKADIVDIGGESAITGRPPVAAQAEIERIRGLVARAAAAGAVVSIDTYKLEVARAAIAAGATIVNDTSGLRDPRLAELCAQTGAALVLMHTRAPPKRRRQEDGLYPQGVTADVLDFLGQRIELACSLGMARDRLIVDPGPDFTKTPAQSVAVLGALERLHALERPILLAISRKDFVGALTSRAPRQRLAGTLAALADGVERGAHLVRVHDVAAASDFLKVWAALRGELPVAPSLRLDDALRHEPADS